GAMLDFGTTNQKMLRFMSLKETIRYTKEGHFPAGSMLPKVEAAIQFVRNKKKKAVITSIKTIEKAVNGKAGTEFIL
ncbi:MAG: carbamate kinase, partial [Thermodesulfobacteriota bacterium]|nr:carbamate kinase [Thermodesulfobacteriota bacterium]